MQGDSLVQDLQKLKKNLENLSLDLKDRMGLLRIFQHVLVVALVLHFTLGDAAAAAAARLEPVAKGTQRTTKSAGRGMCYIVPPWVCGKHGVVNVFGFSPYHDAGKLRRASLSAFLKKKRSSGKSTMPPLMRR